ncbi:MAG: hypothetical protein C5B58_04030 [Acidobacteria bacterium]|nr:MAG: hypothetical protein C5B58_04030 [Acidobacteriota bacterium]
MKRNSIGILTMAAFLLLISAMSAYAQTTAKAAVPFAFTVGQTEMPAGTYVISSLSPSVITIRDADTGKAILSLVRLERAGGSNGNPKMVFSKYGTRYFLSQVSRGYGSDVMQLPTSKLERELQIANAGSVPEQKTIVAKN